MSREGDIAAIRRRCSDRYHREGSCMVAGLSEEGHGSKCFAGDALIVSLLKEIISGNARMSGCATNHATKKMYIELSFFEEDKPDGKVDQQ